MIIMAILVSIIYFWDHYEQLLNLLKRVSPTNILKINLNALWRVKRSKILLIQCGIQSGHGGTSIFFEFRGRWRRFIEVKLNVSWLTKNWLERLMTLRLIKKVHDQKSKGYMRVFWKRTYSQRISFLIGLFLMEK